jgi:hypothetical protein
LAYLLVITFVLARRGSALTCLRLPLVAVSYFQAPEFHLPRLFDGYPSLRANLFTTGVFNAYEGQAQPGTIDGFPWASDLESGVSPN